MLCRLGTSTQLAHMNIHTGNTNVLNVERVVEAVQS